MPLSYQDKQKVVEEVAIIAKSSLSIVAAEYRGLTVSAMTRLRFDARKAGVTLKVVRNNLARRAFEGTDYECMQESLVGPLILAFSREDPGAAARLCRDFAKDNELFKVHVLSLGGKLHGAKDLDAVANLPTYDQAVAQLMSVMLAPITKLVRTLAEPHAKLVRVIAAIGRQKAQEE